MVRRGRARRGGSIAREAGFVGLATEWWHLDAPGRDPRSDAPLQGTMPVR